MPKMKNFQDLRMPGLKTASGYLFGPKYFDPLSYLRYHEKLILNTSTIITYLPIIG